MLRRTTSKTKPSAIFDLSKVAVREWLKQQWKLRVVEPSLHVTFAPTLDAFRQVASVSGQVGAANREALPFISLVVASVTERGAGWAPWSSQFVGYRMGFRGAGREQAVIEKIRPVDIGIGLRFRTNAEDELDVFTEMMLANRPNARIDLMMAETGSIVELAIDIESAITYPTPDMNGPGQFRDAEITLIVKSWLGMTEYQNVVRSVELAVHGSPTQQTDTLPIVTSRFVGNKLIVQPVTPSMETSK